MQREEPRIGAPDLSEIDFRRGENRNIPAHRPGYNLWWQIAVGVFIALMAHSMVWGVYARWEANEAMKELNAEMAKEAAALERQMRAIQAQATHPTDNRPWPTSTRVPSPPLRDGERCIKGERFRRVENGWEHLPRQPC